MFDMDDLQFTYKRLDDHLFEDVQFLFLTVFNKKKSITYLKNKYNTSYLGSKFICYLAYHNNQPVAFYGAIPQQFTSNSKSILVAHACDSFTLKNFQGKGLHYNLAIKSYELMKAEGIKLVYAYHSENTYFSTKKLGWLEHKNMKRFHFYIHTIPLAKIIQKLNLERIYTKFCAVYLKKYLNSKETDSSSNKFKQEYNKDFIKYKDGFNSHYFIQLNSCSFWIKVDAVLHVGFFTCDSDENFKKAISKLKKIAFFLGVNEILFQVLEDSKEFQFLSKLEKGKLSWLIGYLPFDTINLNDIEFNYADLDTF